jgi:molybdopterin molybdotransferase
VTDAYGRVIPSLLISYNERMTVTFQPNRPAENMISVEEAQERVLGVVRALAVEGISLADAQGRTLREDVLAPFDVPEGDNTAMDGYAVRAGDVAEAPLSLRVIGDLPAGSSSTVALQPNTAIRIMTGALMPAGADAVVNVELTDAGAETVRILKGVKRGANIRRQGEDMRAGDLVLRAGTFIGPAEIGVLASVQKSRLAVGSRPTVAILSTGDEVIDVHAARERGKVVNSNAWSLAALARDTGACMRVMPHVPDTREATAAAIAEAALASDFIISSGGVSAGAWDFVKDALEENGAEILFSQIAMKPGKPVVFATLRDRLYFGLPGNPVSCMVAFILFVAPALRKAQGQSTNLLPPTVRTRLASPMSSKGDRRSYHRVVVVAEEGELVSRPMRSQGSGVSTSMVQANGLAIVETGQTAVSAGALIPTVLFGPVYSGQP